MLDVGICKWLAGWESVQYVECYENLRLFGVYICFVMFSSDVIWGIVVMVFVLVFKIEWEFIQAYCGLEWEDGEWEEW